MKNISQETLKNIALEHHEVIPVLEKYSLDFCCRGSKTLADACTEKNISVETIVEEMEQSTSSAKPQMPFTEMNSEQLISYILIHHHFYVKNAIPTINTHLEKVVAKHGDRYPHMKKILQLFTAVSDELLPHMQKEELILFPRIKELFRAVQNQQHLAFPSNFIDGPINVMEAEHDNAGQLMFTIRELTNNYTAPETACTTHRVCLEELKTFENDLHQHVHLENNILFQSAKKMMLN
ncbi:iron-sulfur cluster repair protein YtfE [mine drainage metagenome]|uniref:Iron-sulfur cluster repair protein YtfE n=1 Tax=mine drainage metagenome TaxID=410659 RepID=A0A1J5SWI8_9ZZZZ